MTPSAVERSIRTGLPVLRFPQTRLPPRWTRAPLRPANVRRQTVLKRAFAGQLEVQDRPSLF
jgi:hypothetical protein